MSISRRTTRSTARSSALSVLGAALALATAAGCSTTNPAGTPTVTVSVTAPSSTASSTAPTPPTSSSVPTVSPTTPAVLSGMPVYFVGESAGAFRLFREFRTVRRIDGPISSTISAMTRLAPLDPDYLNPWRPASSVRVAQNGDTLTVDLSADAFRNTNVGSELATIAVQQLVYTATAAAHQAGHDASRVAITVGGKPYAAWGVVALGAPTSRAPLADVQAQAWVVDPQQGEVVPAGRVDFLGYGTSFEATFHWSVQSSTGTVVAHGTASGGSMGTFGPVRWSATLKPGAYTVRLETDDPSEGEGHGPAVDTKQFAVR